MNPLLTTPIGVRASAPLGTTPRGDSLETLPVDQTEPTEAEKQLVNSLFKEKVSTVNRFLNGIRDVLLLGLLFLLVCLPQTGEIIQKFCPSTCSSVYMLLLVRTLVFMLLYFIVKNLYLARMQK